MSKVYIQVEALFGRTTKQKGTVTIDRASRTISVRQKHAREEFILPLDDIADYVVLKNLRAKATEKLGERKKRARKVSRGLLSVGR